MRLPYSLASSAFLVFSVAASAAEDPLSQPNCYTLHDVPGKVEQLGPIPCKCGSAPTAQGSVSLPVGGSGATVTVNASPGGANGGLTCHQSTWVTPPSRGATPGGPVQATLEELKVLGFHETCNLSGCRSLLWGLVTWGGPACVKTPFDTGQWVPHWTFTGFCPVEF